MRRTLFSGIAIMVLVMVGVAIAITFELRQIDTTLSRLAVETNASRAPVEDARDQVREAVRDCRAAIVVLLATGLFIGLATAVITARGILRAERTIEAQRNRLNATLRSIGDGVIVTDRDQYITFLNPIAESLTGWTLSEAQGLSLSQVFRTISESTRDPISPPLQVPGPEEFQATRSIQALLITRAGTERSIDSTRSAIFDEKGEVVGIVRVFRDTADQRAVERALKLSEQFNRRIVESSQDTILVLDSEGRLVSMSPAGQEKMEIGDLTPLIMKSWIDSWKGESRAFAEEALTQAKKGGVGRFQGFLPTFSGRPKWWDVVVTPIRDGAGTIIQILVVSRDVTEIKRYEEALRKTAEALQVADRRKNEFLAMLGHELRNPLAPISNSVAILSQLEGSLPPSIARVRETIDRQVTKLTRLVDDLLDASRVFVGRLGIKSERVDLVAIVKDAVETSRHAFEARGHQLNVELPAGSLWIQGDAVRLVQMVSNLLGNSAKYTKPEGGIVWVSLQQAGNDALLKVRDNGIGIAPEMIPVVFDLFTQVDNDLARTEGGLGIGLSLVRRIAELHGGRARAKSDGLGSGSEFTIELPGVDAAVQEVPKTVARVDGSKRHGGLDLIVVDDNPDSARSLALLLEIAGHVVRVAQDGISALRAAEAHRPDLLILDIGLPGLDGYEVARRVRQRYGRGRVVLIAVTGYGHSEAREKTKAAGFDHHLTKPVSWNVLKELVDNIQPSAQVQS